MTWSRLLLGAGLCATTLVGVHGCQPRALCDVYPDAAECKPPIVDCKGPLIDLTSPFTLSADSIVLKGFPTQEPFPAASLQLDYLDEISSTPPSTGPLSATMSRPAQDGLLLLKLTKEALQKLAPRRGGIARIKVTFERWTSEPGPGALQNGCAFVLAPRFSPTAGKFTVQLQGLSQPQSTLLFVGQRVDCAGAMAASCGQSSALYVSYTTMDPMVYLRQLQRFVLDPSAGGLRDDPQLQSAFRLLPMSDRQPASAVIATAAQLVLRSGQTNALLAMPAASANPVVTLSSPSPPNESLHGIYDQERLLITNGTALSYYDLPLGATAATLRKQISLPTPKPFRLLVSAPRPWSFVKNPDALLFSDGPLIEVSSRHLRDVSLVCLDDPAGCPDKLLETAKTQLAASPFIGQNEMATDLEPVLADLDTDGRSDLVVLNRKTHLISWMPQRRHIDPGPGPDTGKVTWEFDDPVPLIEIPGSDHFVIADFNGDGLLDLGVLVLDQQQGTTELQVLVNQALLPQAGS